MRVVSLVPSVTETLLAWGVVPVACTRFCEQPTLAHVGGTKDPDVDAIVALAPDLVVVEREENRAADAEALAARGVALHVMHVVSVHELPDALDALAGAVGAGAGGAAVRIALAGLAPVPGPRRRAYVPIWRRPWMTIGGQTYANELLRLLGIDNAWADAPGYPEAAPGERPVDVVLAPTEPYPFAERHLAELARLAGAPARLVDGQDLFWWGARTPAALERLREALAP